MTSTRLGRERIPGRTILAAIGEEESYPILCPGFECGTEGRMLDVSDQGDASCPACDLTIAGILPDLLTFEAEATAIAAAVEAARGLDR
jgi:hypothetical protein